MIFLQKMNFLAKIHFGLLLFGLFSRAARIFGEFQFRWFGCSKNNFLSRIFSDYKWVFTSITNFICVAWLLLLLLLPFTDENFIYLNIVSEMDMYIFMQHTKCNQWMGDSCLRITQFAIAIKKFFSAISYGNIHIRACGRCEILDDFFFLWLFWMEIRILNFSWYLWIYVWYF